MGVSGQIIQYLIDLNHSTLPLYSSALCWRWSMAHKSGILRIYWENVPAKLVHSAQI